MFSRLEELDCLLVRIPELQAEAEKARLLRASGYVAVPMHRRLARIAGRISLRLGMWLQTAGDEPANSTVSQPGQ